MQVNYCDLCNSVLKHERHIVIIVHDKEFQLTQKPVKLNQQARDTHEICSECLDIVKKIFQYKKGKLTKIKEYLDNMYNIIDEGETKNGR